MNRRIWTLAAAILLLVCMLAAGVTATEETTVTFAPYTDADGVRQYCACGNKFVADENGTIAYVNGENGCKNHKENGVVTAGCDGTLISWSPVSGSNQNLSGNPGKGFYLTGSTSLANANTCNAAGNYYIDLNNNMLYRNNSRAMTMVAGSNLYITDTSANKSGSLRCRNTDSKASSGQGMVLWMNGENISVNLFAGTIYADEPTTYATGGAAIYCNKSTGKVNVFGGTVRAGTVTGGNAGVAMIGGTFNLYGGAVTGGSGVKGGAIYVGSSATLNIEGGTVTGGTASNQGGAVYNEGTVTMSGGKILRGTDVATAVVYNADTFTITGGTIDGTTAGDGAQKGAIMTATGSELTVNGGTVTGNPKSIYAYAATVNIQGGAVDGNQLYINGGSVIKVTGGTVNQEIYLASGSAEISGTAKVTNGLNFKDTDQTATIGTLTEGAELRVKTLGVADAVLPYYTLTDASALNYMYDNDVVRDMYWIEGEGLYVGKYNCAVCGGVYSGCDHAEKVKYTGTATLPTTTGHYYLTDSFEAETQASVAENAAIVLDLNGQTVTRAGRIYGMSAAGATLTITDTGAEGKLSSSGAGNGQGKVVMINNASAMLNLYAGTLDAAESTNTNYGGAVSIIGAFNMYGGSVVGGGVLKTTSTSGYGVGGAISVGKASSFTMCGGTVTGGEAKLGGAIGLKNEAVATITGGTIVSGKGTNGTAIYVNATSNVTIRNAAVVGGTSGTTIWNCGTLTLSGKVDMPAANFDIMVDGRSGEDCYLDIKELTEVTDPISVRRWVKDAVNDDEGIFAINATEAQQAMFEAKKEEYYDVVYADGTLQLQEVACNFFGANSKGEYVDKFEDLADLSAADASVTYYRAGRSCDGITIGSSILLDLNGKTLTNVTIPEGVTVYGMDSTTDDYDCTDGYGTISGTVNGTIAMNIKTTAAQIGTVKRYLTVTEDGVTSFHRFYMGVTHMSLRPGVTGVGYKAVFCGDSVVQQQVVSYGFNLWVADGQKHSASKAVLESGKTVSLRLQNFDVANYGEADVNATVFMQFANGVTVESDTYSYTLRSLVEQINGLVDSFTDAQMSALKVMCENNAAAMSGWDIANILNWTATETA